MCQPLQKNKRDYFKRLNNKVISENRRLWKIRSPPVSEKMFHKETITLKDNNRATTNNQELELLIQIIQFTEITQNLDTSDLALKAVKKYENTQVSSQKREGEEQEYVLIFAFVCSKAILNELPKLDPKNACQESDIPVKT